jgi:hypothetical protein
MPDDRIGTAPGAPSGAQIPVSPNNPCPFLRALVANGYVGGHVVPLSQISEMVGLASGETGSAQNQVRLKTKMVAVIANGLGPLSVLKSATSGAVLDDTFMKANLKRDGDAARWYYPLLMKGEWPVLLKILGKGEGDERYLSVAEVRTLFVEKRLPERITARLPKPASR